MKIYGNIALNSSYNERCFRQICIENENTQVVVNNFFPKSCRYEIMWKDIFEPDKLQMTV